MLKNKQPSFVKKTVKWAVVALFYTACWIGAYGAVNQPLLLPSPLQVIRQMGMVITGRFWITVGMTILRTMTAYLSGIMIACALAAASSVNEWCDAIIRPAMHAVRATPVASFIILALVWLSAGKVPVLAGILMVVPVIYGNVTEGISATDPRLLEMAKMYGFTGGKKWRCVIIPSVLPTFLAGCKSCVGLCFKATIAAEVIGIPKNAIGSQLHNAKVYLETDQLIAWTVLIILMSVIIEKLVSSAFERWMKRVNHT